MSSGATTKLPYSLPLKLNPSPLSPTQTPCNGHVKLELRIHHASTLRSNPTLAEEIRRFANEGYKYMADEIKPRWEYFYGDRLPTPKSLFNILGEDGCFAVLYTQEAGKGGMGTPIACAATKRWTGDLEGRKATMRADGEIKEDDEGWEILCVTTHVDFMKKGYAGGCINALILKLRGQARRGRQSQGRDGEDREGKSEQDVGVDRKDGADDERSEDSDGRTSKGEISAKLTIWTQAIEELNGQFWRNRGWKEVRRYNKPVGSWRSKFGYELLVLIREVEVEDVEVGIGKREEY